MWTHWLEGLPTWRDAGQAPPRDFGEVIATCSLPEAVERAVGYLPSLPSEDLIAWASDSRPQLRVVAAVAMARRCRQYRDSLANLLRDPDRTVAECAAVTLGLELAREGCQTGSQWHASPFELLFSLVDPEDTDQREKAVLVTIRHLFADLVDRHYELDPLQDPLYLKQEAAVSGAGRLAEPGIIEGLTHSDRRVRGAAMFCVGSLDPDRFWPSLERGLDDRDVQIAFQAVASLRRWVRHRGTPVPFPLLAKLSTSGVAPAIVADILGTQPDPIGFALLEPLLIHPSYEVRLASVDSVERLAKLLAGIDKGRDPFPYRDWIPSTTVEALGRSLNVLTGSLEDVYHDGGYDPCWTPEHTGFSPGGAARLLEAIGTPLALCARLVDLPPDRLSRYLEYAGGSQPIPNLVKEECFGHADFYVGERCRVLYEAYQSHPAAQARHWANRCMERQDRILRLAEQSRGQSTVPQELWKLLRPVSQPAGVPWGFDSL